jgi:hypothetical protein
MSDYINRLVDEEVALREKMRKLNLFLIDPENGLTIEQTMLLGIQYSAMQTYAKILNLRFEHEMEKGKTE